MSKELDKLIEQMLQEKVLGISFVPGSDGTMAKEKPKSIDFRNKIQPYTDTNKNTARNRKLRKLLRGIANKDKPNDQLDPDDFIKVLETSTATELKQFIKNALGTGVKRKFYDDLFPLIDEYEKQTQRYKNLKTQAAKQDVMQTIKQTDPDKVKMADTKGKGFELGTFPSVYSGMDSSETNYNKVDPDKVRPDPMLYKVFRSIDGETIIKKFTNLQIFASYIMEGKLDDWMTNELKANANDPTPEQEFKALNYAMVLTMLGDSSKTGDSSNAGYFFEGFLGYLISAPVVGKAGGAADNIAKIASTGKGLMLSAKFYVNLTQTHQDEAGMIKDLQNSTQTGQNNLYYLTITKEVTGKSKGIKTMTKTIKASGGEFDTLNLYLTRYWAQGNKIYGVALDESGVDQPGTVNELEINEKKDAKLFSGNLAKAKPLLVFPVLPLGGIKPKSFKKAKEYIATQTATQVAEQIQKSSQKKLKAFVNVVSSLKDLEYKSKEYSGDRANRAFATKRGPTASDAIKQIHNSYSGLYDNYKTLFSDVEDRKQFKESKSPLDQLIEAIIKEKLLK